MKKALACALSLAMLLSLSACHKPQAEQPDNSAATSTQADVSIPEPDNTPAPEPPKASVPEQLSDTIPAAPAENEDPQPQSEPAAQEPAETEPVKTETPKQTAPKADNSPAESKPAEQAQEQQPATQPSGGGLTADQRKALEDAGFKFSDSNKKKEETQSQQMPSAEEIEAYKRATDPGYYVDEHGAHSSAADGDEDIKFR